jgi:two-component system alkaline phosphatase synthesis response regulator PhoP
MTTRIAIIDDDVHVRELVTAVLAEAGYEAVPYVDGKTALQGLLKAPPAMVLLDIGLPGMDGLQVCRAIRADPRTARLPVIMLTGAVGEADQVLGFEVGADDYVTKPWQGRSLVARIRAVLRRSQAAGDDVPQVYGPLTLHPGRHEAVLDGKALALTPTEFRILLVLLQHPDRALSRSELLLADPDGRDGSDRNVDVHVLSIRRKLGRHHGMVETVWGKGYRLGPAAEAAAGGTGDAGSGTAPR